MNKHQHDFISIKTAPGVSSEMQVESIKTGEPAESRINVLPDKSHLFMFSPTASSYFSDRVVAQFAKDPTSFAYASDSYIDNIAKDANQFMMTTESIKTDSDVHIDLKGNQLNTIVDTISRSGHPWLAQLVVDKFAPLTTGPDKKMMKFLAEPITLATIYAISQSNAFPANIRPMIMLHYLTLAHGESELTSNAHTPRPTRGNPRPTARGQLQITDATYADAISYVKHAAIAIPNYTELLISKFFTKISLLNPGWTWAAKNKKNPAKDSTYYLANLGVLARGYKAMTENWYWKDGKRRSNSHNPNPIYLQHKYSDIMSDPDDSRQLLMTYYHINGFGADYLKKLSIAHESRLTEDVQYFIGLSRIPGFSGYLYRLAQTMLHDHLSEKGDPSPEGIGVDGYNSYIARTYKIKGRLRPSGTHKITSYFGYRKVNKNRGVYNSDHKGLDLHANEGTPVFAPDDGVIINHYTQPGKGWGKSMLIRFDRDRACYRIAHLSHQIAPAGTRVLKGQIIATTGHTGTVEPHLHVEYIPEGVSRVNPMDDRLRRWKYFL